MNTSHSSSLTASYLNKQNNVLEQLEKNRFWYVLPEGKTDPAQAKWILDAHSQLLYPQTNKIQNFFQKKSFIHICPKNNDEALFTLHVASMLLWTNTYSDKPPMALERGREFIHHQQWAGLSGWKLPTKTQLIDFANANHNPFAKNKKLKTLQGYSKSWLTTDGGIDLEYNLNTNRQSPVSRPFYAFGHQLQSRAELENSIRERELRSDGRIYACHDLWVSAPLENILADLHKYGWKLASPQGETFVVEPDGQLKNIKKQDLLTTLAQRQMQLIPLTGKKGSAQVIVPRQILLQEHLVNLDYRPCRLPQLDNAQLSDPEKGLWELWGEDLSRLEDQNLVARDPARDVQDRSVAIDFGTSSTVVAMDTLSGGRELLRIGVRDFYQKTQPSHFENPTVLECKDYTKFFRAWTSKAYRPELDWDWVCAAHEAQTNFRDNPGDTQVLARIIPRLKQWALQAPEKQAVRLADLQEREVEIPAHAERNPVRGQALEVSSDDLFDPIELYAWYLGMAINWRGRGLFLKYYLSFPVKYPQDVRNRILASFSRGLQRSLPQSLIKHYPKVLNDFEVKDLASEPAAYAAAALPYLQVEPTEKGVPYAVFDFGGGTTDFDFGIMRWATDEEEDQGYERVFEHVASSGDNFLGGENLLEHLVFTSFRRNLDVLRDQRIQFTQPDDAQTFPGGEAFLANTQAAKTNTIMLAAKLRPFVEEPEPTLERQIKLELINVDGEKKTCELTLDEEELDALLAQRIRDGALAFLAELAQVWTKLGMDAAVHILLAGNASRSRYVKVLFDTENEEWKNLLHEVFGDSPPVMEIHQPLSMNQEDPHAPTAKTGVALGLLQLVPGENILLKNHVHEQHYGQAPFNWFVGKMRRGCFSPSIEPGHPYGEWQELGALQQGVFNLFISASPRARGKMQEGDPELKKFRRDFPSAPQGARLFARAKDPNTIELAAGLNDADLENCTYTVLNLE